MSIIGLAIAWNVGLALPAHAQNGLFEQGKNLIGAVGKSPGGRGGGLSNSEIGSGLKEALQVGADRVVTRVDRADGFDGDPDPAAARKRHPRQSGAALDRVAEARLRLGMNS